MSKVTRHSEVERRGDSSLDKLVEYLLSELGENLHWVVSAEENDGLVHTIHYFNTDVQEELYGNNDRHEIAQEMVFSTLEEEYLKDLYQLGDPHFSVKCFEEATLLKFLIGNGTAKTVTVGTESTDNIDHTSVALECLDMLKNEMN